MKNTTLATAAAAGVVAILSAGLAAFPEAAATVREIAEFGVIVAGVVAVFGTLAILAGAAIALTEGGRA